jgi:hypothetical protein
MEYDLKWPQEKVQVIRDQVCSPGLFTQTAENLKREIYIQLTETKTGSGTITPGSAKLDFSWMDQSSRKHWLEMYERGSISTGGYTSYLQSQAAWERSMAAVNVLSSALNIMMILADANLHYAMIEKNIRQKYSEMFPFRLASTIQAQRNGLYGPYCVRPFIRASQLIGMGPGRWGFILVDMRTGEWQEITTSPHEHAFTLLTLNLIPVLFTTEGNMLITRGVGLKTDTFHLRTGMGDGATPYPGLSLMAYRLEDIPLKPADSYHKEKKLIFGEPIDAEAELTLIKPNATTMAEIKERLGEPYSLVDYYGEVWAKWLYAEEIRGIVAYDGLKCDFDSKGVVTKVKRECWPHDIVEDKCLTIEEYIKEDEE